MKLKAHGIVGKVLDWIENWLTSREQRVVLNGSKSKWSRVVCGVPQGSVLGPLLFVIYINDIDESVTSKLLKFVGDTKVFRVVNSTADIDREDLRNLFKWSEDWLMLFNIDKCLMIHFGGQNKRTAYEMGGQSLTVVDCERDLGVIIQADLKV